MCVNDQMGEAQRRLDAMERMLPALEQELIGIQQGRLEIETKQNDFDLVTQADRASEARLVTYIREHFPEDGLVGEEGAELAASGPAGEAFRWVLDPIDGTINYANRLPIWAISIGLMRGDQQVGGIVSGPGLGLRYRATLGGGAFCNGVPIQVNRKVTLGEGVVVTGFPYDRAKRVEPLCEALGNLLRTAGGVRRFGAAALDFCFVADGRFTGYYEMGLQPWDSCAGSLIALEAGAVVTDLAGEPFDVFKSSGFIVANAQVHAELVRAAAPMLKAVAIE